MSAPPPARPQDDRRRHTHPLLSFELLVRWSILSTSTVTCLLGWAVPQSLTSVLLVAGGAMGEAVLLALTAAVCIGWADVLVNDVLPDRFKLRLVKASRHLGYSIIGGLYMLQAFVSVGSSIGPEDLLPFGYLLNAIVCGWYSWTTAWRGWHV